MCPHRSPGLPPRVVVSLPGQEGNLSEAPTSKYALNLEVFTPSAHLTKGAVGSSRLRLKMERLDVILSPHDFHVCLWKDDERESITLVIGLAVLAMTVALRDGLARNLDRNLPAGATKLLDLLSVGHALAGLLSAVQQDWKSRRWPISGA